MSLPCGVCTTSGWNWTPYRFLSGLSNAATGVDGEVATTSAPSGARVTVSRWLIQTVCSPGVPSSSRPPRASSGVLPNSETPVRSTVPPSSRAIRVYRRGAAAQDQGERVARADTVGGDVVRDELGVDAALADAARDQLRV